jgi:hypothetical protein
VHEDAPWTGADFSGASDDWRLTVDGGAVTFAKVLPRLMPRLGAAANDNPVCTQPVRMHGEVIGLFRMRLPAPQVRALALAMAGQAAGLWLKPCGLAGLECAQVIGAEIPRPSAHDAAHVILLETKHGVAVLHCQVGLRNVATRRYCGQSLTATASRDAMRSRSWENRCSRPRARLRKKPSSFIRHCEAMFARVACTWCGGGACLGEN